ncbi:MAG: hypothetical protein JSU09_09900 [Bacteroidetes bacterium]|nr:hypothetical protein [Bacteroidota bacterium]
MFSLSTKFRWSSLLGIWLNAFCLHAQVEQTARWEMPVNQEGEVYKIAPADSLGVVAYSKNQGQGIDQIELIRMDTALREVWKGYISVQKFFAISFAHVYQEKLFLLLSHSYNPVIGFLVVELNIRDGRYLTHAVKNIIPFKPTEFTATNGALLIGGYYNYRPLVLHYSLSKKQSKILPGFFNEPGEINQIKVNDDFSVDIIISANNQQKRKSLWLRNYNQDGDLLKTTVLEPQEKRSLLFGRSVKTTDNHMLVAGVYGRNTEYSRGIFVSTISPYGEYTTRYYNFADLQNFFRFMRVNQEKRVKKRIERKRIKGKRIKFNYRFLVQEVIPYRDQFVMLGEAFYPRYVYQTRNTNPAFFGYQRVGGYQFYSPYRSDQIFDGFQYTHAIAIGFDSKGKVIWDNSFEINDAKSFQLEQFVKIAPTNDHIDLIYFYQNLIRSKVIQGSQVLEGKTADEIKMLSPTDYVSKKDVQPNRLQYWYGNHLLASGFQNIRVSPDRLADIKKRVFFINKIRYR